MGTFLLACSLSKPFYDFLSLRTGESVFISPSYRFLILLKELVTGTGLTAFDVPAPFLLLLIQQKRG
jgi:hypothetical protein